MMQVPKDQADDVEMEDDDDDDGGDDDGGDDADDDDGGDDADDDPHLHLNTWTRPSHRSRVKSMRRLRSRDATLNGWLPGWAMRK